jgi:hypothetical protein
MVGDGQGRHPESYSLLKEGVDRIRAVQQAVLGMTMEMNEVGMLHGFVRPGLNFKSFYRYAWEEVNRAKMLIEAIGPDA